MCTCWTTVSQSQLGMIESLGKFQSVATPGCVCLNPCTESIAGQVSLRVRSFVCDCESKSRDNVMVTIRVVINTKVIPEKAVNAYYMLTNPQGQLTSYAMNVIRGMLAQHTLDEVFLMRSEMQKHLKTELDAQLEQFGYLIVAALVTDIRLSQTLKNAMEATVTNARMKQAIQYKSESDKLQTIKAAEGDAEAKRLSGVGLAEQRKAAIMGLQESVANFEQSIPGMKPKDIMSLLLMNQYFDAIKDIAEVSRGHTVFLPDTNSRSMEMTEGTLAAAGASATAMGQIHARRQAAANRK
jgi:regulator of protease activity HflC (stomatin/prohibitin superfamily)